MVEKSEYLYECIILLCLSLKQFEKYRMEITLDYYILFYFTGGLPTGRVCSHVHRMHHANMAWIWVSAPCSPSSLTPSGSTPPPHTGSAQALTWPPSTAHLPRWTFHLLGPGVPGKNINAPVQCSTPPQTEPLQMHLRLLSLLLWSLFLISQAIGNQS